MITFHLFYARVDGIKVVLNSRQQIPAHQNFLMMALIFAIKDLENRTVDM
jgi:hypothetical protein